MNNSHTVLGKGTAKAKRINLNTSRSRTVECELTWIDSEGGGRVLTITKGGVTGTDNVGIGSAEELLAFAQTDWCACKGTPGGWDRLLIPQVQLEKAVKNILAEYNKGVNITPVN